jgi:hypothetical protein
MVVLENIPVSLKGLLKNKFKYCICVFKCYSIERFSKDPTEGTGAVDKNIGTMDICVLYI